MSFLLGWLVIGALAAMLFGTICLVMERFKQ